MVLKKILITIAVMACLCAGVMAYVFYLVKSPLISCKDGDSSFIYIDSDDTSDSIINKIKEISPSSNMLGFRILAKHNNLDKQKHTGKFAITDGDDMHSLYLRLVSNRQTPVMVTIPATRTVEQLVSSVCKQLMMDSAALSRFTTSPIYYETIGYTKETLPTLFLPNTYEFYWDIAPERFMIRMMKEHRNFWNDERKAKAASAGLSIVEVATLASIVDEETNNNQEKPVVAGLYINRLKRGMLLQADPTVKFALGDFARKRILKADLETDSPYNTYKYAGLPPGPIRIPTLQGIESVLNYTKHNYLYMCAKEDFSGTHNFAATLSQHNANAERYRNALNKLNIKK